MSGYEFRLQKLLEIRIDKEEESKIKFKEAQSEKNKTENKLTDLKEKYALERNRNSSSTVIERKIQANYLRAMSMSIDDTNDELDKHIINLENKRSELEKKQIERKTVEILKDKKMDAYNKEQAMIEQKTNDEFALYGFIRRNHNR